MNHHLSREQFARCFVGAPTNAERQHLGKCLECRTELDRFAGTIASFRSAVRSRIEKRMTMRVPMGLPLSPGSLQSRTKWRPALAAAAAIVLGVFPFFLTEPKLPHVNERVFSETTPDALMDAISLHLLRTVPAPMEPAMALIPTDDLSKRPGGIQ